MSIFNWDEEKKEIIEKLQSNLEIFTKILKEDSNCLVIKEEDKKTLQGLINRSDEVLKKLNEGIFTVALVGLEKSGKSTFGNALLQLNVLPSEFQRCTFTTTTICAGSDDIGKIKFYTSKEFNDYFNALLKIIKYPEKLNDFTELDITKFEKFCSEQDCQNINIAEDIKTIINGKDCIKSLLDTDLKTFTGSKELESDNFKQYITGIEEHDEKGLAVRSAIPYSVSSIEIQSTKLGDMKDIVLYDVPGFDSPTDLHKKQTVEMLKKADAIILVSSIGGDNAHLTGTHLDILKQYRDDDDITLSDKTFAFGNKLDKSDSKKDAELRINVFKSDAIEKCKIVKESHFFFGSALEYLYNKKIINPEDGSKVDFRLQKLGFSDGIEDLKNSMRSYYNNDRFDILSKRAENILNDAKKLLNSICQKFSDSYSKTMSIDYAVEATLALCRKLEEFYKRLNELYHDISNNSQFSFTSSIKNDIEKIYPQEVKDSENLRIAKLDTNIDSDNIYPETKIDSTLRERLKVDFIKKIVRLTDDQIGKEENKIYERLANEFLKIIGANENSHYYNEMKYSVRCVFNKILQDKGEKCRFNTLVERFNTSLIEAVIQAPFAQTERLRKIKANLPEFFSLSAYYAMNTDDTDYEIGIDNENLRMSIFSQILAHNDIVDINENEIKNSFDNFFSEEKIKKLLSAGTSFALDIIPMPKLVKIVTKSGIAFDKFAEQLKKAFYNDSWSKKQPDDKKNIIIETVEKTCNYEDSKISHKDGLIKSLDLFQEEASKKKDAIYKKIEDEAKNAKHKNELIEKNMLDIINEDIIILRNITVNSVLKAIGLERAFLSTISNNIELIRNDLKKKEDSEFDTWIKENIAKIKEDEFKKIEDDRKSSEIKKKVFDYINELLSKFN